MSQVAYDPEDENIDHLAGSRAEPVISRAESRQAARLRIENIVREHGPDWDSTSPALKADVRRHFGSWTQARRAAGV